MEGKTGGGREKRGGEVTGGDGELSIAVKDLLVR